MICFNCGSYGHSRKFCQQPSICLRCSVQHDTPEGEQCTNPPSCLHCKAEHQATSRDCPKYQQEEKIVRLKVDRNVSITEARRIFAEENKQETFAGVVQEQIQQQLAAKDVLIVTLQKQVAALTKEVAVLRNVLKSSTQSQSTSQRDQQIATTRQRSSSKNPSNTTTPQNQPTQRDRLSRKDHCFITPQTDQLENLRNNREQYNVQTRSRSSKRHMEISPTETVNNRGKRISAQSNTSSASTNAETNNGPGSS